jgi:hypothetical protein
MVNLFLALAAIRKCSQCRRQVLCPRKLFSKEELSSSILTQEIAKRQLSDREKRKQGREDFDEGYHQ